MKHSSSKLTRPWKKEYGTVIPGDSLTVPGEAYTIQQLYERANAGVPLDVSVNVKEGHFATEADFDTFAPEGDFDIIDAQEQQIKASEIIKDAKEAIKNQSKGSKKTTTQQSDEGVIPETTKDKKPIADS